MRSGESQPTLEVCLSMHTHTHKRDNVYQQLEWRYGPKDSCVHVSSTGETDSGTSTGDAD